MGLIQLFISDRHLYLSGGLLNVDLKVDIKNSFGLTHTVKIVTFLDSIVNIIKGGKGELV